MKQMVIYYQYACIYTTYAYINCCVISLQLRNVQVEHSQYFQLLCIFDDSNYYCYQDKQLLFFVLFLYQCIKSFKMLANLILCNNYFCALCQNSFFSFSQKSQQTSNYQNFVVKLLERDCWWGVQKVYIIIQNIQDPIYICCFLQPRILHYCRIFMYLYFSVKKFEPNKKKVSRLYIIIMMIFIIYSLSIFYILIFLKFYFYMCIFLLERNYVFFLFFAKVLYKFCVCTKFGNVLGLCWGWAAIYIKFLIGGIKQMFFGDVLLDT
eukprot:TRINITY_DN28959_c0_g1_i6.p1 TRINITY_DN28959_c0_g1~~TRINITY_DN28959_c0_g1_i6.p1  ORF type:complete len:265 (-),score=-13.57 TRINITY_DN28959_c0_g1_i6:73-867(-)